MLRASPAAVNPHRINRRIFPIYRLAGAARAQYDFAMSTLFLRSLAVSSISVLLLAGCSSKKYQAKIKDLEAEIENLETEKEEALDAKDEEMRDKEQEFEKTEQESTAKIDEITQERDRLNSEISDLKQKVAQLEAEIDAKTPKDASTPGHEDFNPAKEEKFANAMATITGDTVSGTGFIAEAGGKRYVYTTAALLGGNSRLAVANAAGTKFTKFGNLEVADGCSFVRLELLEADDAPALQIGAAGFQITTESKLCCLGITPTTGTVTGEMIAPFGQSNETIDLDPNLLTGKTGGPIIDTTTGKVLAIITSPATARADLWETTPDTAEVQLGASRINRDLTWQPLPIATFLAEGKKLADFDRFTKVVQAFAAMAPTAEGLGVDAEVANSETVKSVLSSVKELPVAVDAMTLHTQLASKKARIGEADLKKRITSLFATVNSMSKRNLASFDPAKFSAFHRKAAEQSLKWRTDAEGRLASTAEGVADLDLKPVDKTPARDRDKDGQR